MSQSVERLAAHSRSALNGEQQQQQQQQPSAYRGEETCKKQEARATRMAKRKSEAGSSSLEANQQKRPRAALNFSIESIMRREVSPPTQIKLEDSFRVDSPTRSSSSSSRSSARSSPTCSSPTEIAVLEEDEEEQQLDEEEPSKHNHQHHHHHHHHRHHHTNHHHNNNNHNTHNHQHEHHQHLHLGQQPATRAASPSGKTQPARLGASSPLSQVSCVLENKSMWEKFHALNTEMIITKTGRRMFPVMKVQFVNLKPDATYRVYMDIIPVDNKRYRYAYHKSCWQVAGKADPSQQPRLYQHPDSPFKGEMLARQVISFEKVKLTNNEMDRTDHIILNSMHKYQPRVYLIEVSPTAEANQQPVALSRQGASPADTLARQQQQQVGEPSWAIEGCRTFIFPETVFTAVTAYQNQLITKLKIDKNPFAKGFRDSSRLSDLDHSDYLSSGPGGPANGSRYQVAPHLEPYQLLAGNPWYSAAALAAVSGASAAASAPGPAAMAGAMSALCNVGGASGAQAAQLQATQMMLAAFNACLQQQQQPAPGPHQADPSTAALLAGFGLYNPQQPQPQQPAPLPPPSANLHTSPGPIGDDRSP